jgi:hypothetical protein
MPGVSVREADGEGRLEGLADGDLLNFVDTMGMLAMFTPPLEMRNCAEVVVRRTATGRVGGCSGARVRQTHVMREAAHVERCGPRPHVQTPTIQATHRHGHGSVEPRHHIGHQHHVASSPLATDDEHSLGIGEA